MTRRYRRRLSTWQRAAVAVAVGLALAGAAHGPAAATHTRTAAPARAAAPARGSRAAAAAVAFATAQLGKPYQWGGTGPGAFDCSGLAMMAWQAAGIQIQRTSQEQWAEGPQVPADQVRPGDLVFFPGGDGTWSAPGHVGIVVDPAKHLMINAYAQGTPVQYATYGPGAVPGSGLDQVVGFTDPAARGGP